jgi:uncharacterized protein
METFIIQLEEVDNKGKAYVGSPTDSGAEMTYSKAGTSLIIIDHTEVSEAFRGLGVGKQLLYALVEMARDKNLKIMPLCPYAKRVFNTDKSIQDVLQ